VVDTFIHGRSSREYGNDGKEGRFCDRGIYQILQKEIFCSLQGRTANRCVPLKARSLLQKIGDSGKERDIDKFKNEVESMYTQSLAYIKIWAKKLEQFKILRFMELKDVPEWDDVQSSLEVFNEKGVIIDGS
jgi:hypothetical protein